jgi:hypothetical protein
MLACFVRKSGKFVSCFSLCWEKCSGNRKSAISRHYHDGVKVCGCIQPFPRLAFNPFCGCPAPGGLEKTLGGRVGSVLACDMSKSGNSYRVSLYVGKSIATTIRVLCHITITME